MSDLATVGPGLVFPDEALEQDFCRYRDTALGSSAAKNMVTALLTVLVGHLAVLIFAPEFFRSYTLVALCAVYPPQLATLVLGPRARTPAELFRLQLILVVADLGGLALSVKTLQIDMGATVGTLATLVILMFDLAIVNRRPMTHIVGMLAVVALVYQVTLATLHAQGQLPTRDLWLASVIIWVTVMQCVTLARNSERLFRQGFLQVRIIARQHQTLAEEKGRSERLLLNVLPEAIAARLRDRPATIADHVPEVSVLFADLAGFTSMSAQMSPAQVVELLNEVFTHFDTLVERHGLEKIKTIGDCYMVAAGVPAARVDHATAIVSLALEMRDAVKSRTFSGRSLEFRFGINSGPVVAGVIGQRKFIYDLWGDTVNVASRMESHGQSNVVQITEQTHALLGDRFECAARGAVAVKGKGELRVWHVLGPRAAG